jgi:MFS family permease
VAWSTSVLALGWSLLEGLGAALVMPAMVALVATNFEGRQRAAAYGVLGGVAGAGIAVGPILGGWCTTYLSWRVVFAGEVLVAIAILLGVRAITESRPARTPQLDGVGAGLSALGLSLVVFGVLQSSTWGWLKPRNSPVEPFGFSLTLFVIGAGALVLVGFVKWQHRRVAHGQDPLVRLELFRIPSLRSGVNMFLAQNLILMGIFFTIPLYLQVVQGYDAFETGLRMLPVSVTLFLTALLGARVLRNVAPRTVVRIGLGVLLVATLGLLSVIDPQIDTTAFAVAMAVLGIGMGLLSSQLGNVLQSSVGDDARGDAGGIQWTGQQLGSALGVALMGAIVIGGLASGFASNIESDPRVSDAVEQQAGIALESGIQFVPADDVRTAADDAGVPPAEVDALVESYSEAQLDALKAGLLLAAFIVVASYFFTGGLPDRPLVTPSDTVESAA